MTVSLAFLVFVVLVVFFVGEALFLPLFFGVCSGFSFGASLSSLLFETFK